MALFKVVNLAVSPCTMYDPMRCFLSLFYCISHLLYRDLPPPALLSNFMGLSVMIFGGIIFYLVHRYDYRRVEPQNGERVGFRSFN
ncbi:hypothetical protein ACTXT7_002802 [Hymenolepis weldensis]